MAQRFHTLDGMRGVAALAVMIWHFTEYTSVSMFPGASLAVDMFFCLSGFVISHSYLDRLGQDMSFGDFVLRRMIRLYPMFLCGLVMGGAVLMLKVSLAQTDLDYRRASIAMMQNLFYLPYCSDFYIQMGRGKSVAPIFPADVPYWSLLFEFAVNLLFGIVALRAKYIGYFIVAALGAVALAMWVKLTWIGSPGSATSHFVGGFPRAIYGFFSGVCVYLVYSRCGRHIPKVNLRYLTILPLVLFLSAGPSYIWLLQSIVLVPAIVLIGACSVATSQMEIRICNYLGWLSYPIYCLHYPVYSFFTMLTKHADVGVWGLLLCAPIAVAISHALTTKLEEPVRKMLAIQFYRGKTS
jgi:peptidoglycan/LPS O-acetylase OafA/YrhL